jgi:hypothetical protein
MSRLDPQGIDDLISAIRRSAKTAAASLSTQQTPPAEAPAFAQDVLTALVALSDRLKEMETRYAILEARISLLAAREAQPTHPARPAADLPPPPRAAKDGPVLP